MCTFAVHSSDLCQHGPLCSTNCTRFPPGIINVRTPCPSVRGAHAASSLANQGIFPSHLPGDKGQPEFTHGTVLQACHSFWEAVLERPPGRPYSHQFPYHHSGPIPASAACKQRPGDSHSECSQQALTSSAFPKCVLYRWGKVKWNQPKRHFTN